MKLDVETVLSKLAWLRERDPTGEYRPSSGCGADLAYTLEPPLTEDQVRACEAQFGVALPLEYRTFVTQVGNGGDGPAYGVRPLEVVEGRWRWRNIDVPESTDLTEPFPHVDAWTGRDHPLWDQEPPKEPPPGWAGRYETPWELWWEAVTEAYYRDFRMPGATTIAENGCGFYTMLIINGPCNGQIWENVAAEFLGFEPMYAQDGSRHTFASWYTEWLNLSVANCATASGESPPFATEAPDRR